MPYSVGGAPSMSTPDGQALAKYVDQEFAAISSSQVANVVSLPLSPIFVPPVRPRTGTVVYADGVKWNPGSGEGIYVFGSDGIWHSAETSPSCFFAGLTSNQTIASGPDVKLLMDDVTLNDGSFYDASTQKWTPPAGRVALFCFTATNSTLVATETSAIIFKNGARLSISFSFGPSALGESLNLSCLIDSCNGSDYYEAYSKWVSSDSSSSFIVADNTRTYFCGHVIK